MDYQDVSAFIAVADAGSIKTAAQELIVSESTVSRRVRALEEDLGLELLVRSRKGTELTAAGRQLLESARHLVDATGQLSEMARTIAAKTHPTLRIGYVGFSYEEVVLVLAAKATARRFPGFEADFIMDRTPELVEKLEQGELDAALLFKGALPEHHPYGMQRVGDSVPIAIVPRSHRLASRKMTTMADFANETFLSEGAHPGPVYDEQFKTQLRSLGASNCEVKPVNSYKSVPALVAAGQGVGIANMWMENPFPKFVSYVPIDEDNYDIHVDFAWRPDVDPTLATVFAGELKAELAALCE